MTKLDNGFIIEEMSGFDTTIPAVQQDRYHMYSVIGCNASNTTHHHEFGDVTVFMRNTSPYHEHDRDGTKMEDAENRYIIIVDAWTGKRIKVTLPNFMED